MRSNLTDLVFPLLVTIFLLLCLNLFATVIFPFVGLTYYIIPFNVLVVLYLGLKLQTIWLPVLIFSIQYFFSFFTIEGWEIGTIAGIIICFIISYLRDIIHLNSAMMTVFVTQVFQIAWFCIVSLLLYFKTSEMVYIVDRFWRFIPESIFISLFAPIAFLVLDKFWKLKPGVVLGDND